MPGLQKPSMEDNTNLPHEVFIDSVIQGLGYII